MPSQTSEIDPVVEAGEAGAPDAVSVREDVPTPDPVSAPFVLERPARPAIWDDLRTINWREPRTAWRQVVELVGLTKLVVGGALVVLVAGAFLLPGGERSDPFDGPGAAMDLVLKLGAVLALAYVSLAALRRYTAGTASQRGTLLEILDSTTLGPNRSVYVVRAGEKRLVLGVTQQQITALAELDGELSPVPALAPQPGEPPLTP
jgi:flagellar biosynthetic protein FliO